MYAVYKDGSLMGYLEKPVYIRKQSNGYYGLATEETAEGVSINGQPYNLFDRGHMDGLETVQLYQEDVGPQLFSTRKIDQAVADIDYIKLMGGY